MVAGLILNFLKYFGYVSPWCFVLRPKLYEAIWLDPCVCGVGGLPPADAADNTATSDADGAGAERGHSKVDAAGGEDKGHK